MTYRTDTLAHEWREGLTKVLIYKIAWMSPLRTGSRVFPWARSAIWAFIITMGIPLSLNFVHRGVPGLSASTSGGVWAIVFATALSFTALVASGFCWAALARRVTWVDEMMSEDLRARAVKHLQRCYRLQWLGMLLGAGLVSVTFLFVPAIGRYIPTNVPAWYSVVVLALVAGSVLMLGLTVPGLITTISVAPIRSRSLVRLNPSATPGISLLIEAIAISSISVLLALVFTAGLAIYIRYSDDLLPTYMQASLPFIVVILVVLLIRVAVAPTIAIHLVLLKSKTDTLADVMKQIEQLGADFPLRRERRSRVERRGVLLQELDMIAAAPTVPFQSGILGQFAAGALGSVLAVVLTWVVGGPPT